MTERTEGRTRRRKKKNKLGKVVLLAVLVLVLLIGGIFGCRAIFKEKPLPVVYAKQGTLYAASPKSDPIAVSENFGGSTAEVIENGKGILYIDADGALCYSSIKSAKAAEKTVVLSDAAAFLTVADNAHIYYIKNDSLFVHNLKEEKELATGVTDIVKTSDGRFVFFSTATDLFGIDTEKDTAPVRIAESVSVYDLLHTAVDWTLESHCLYYTNAGKFARINEDLTETVLCENAAIGFVLDGSVYAVTETQIDEDAFKTALVRFEDTNPTQIASDLLGTEAVSQLYPGKKYMRFTKQSEKNKDKESYYTLDAKGNFRYLCEDEGYTDIFTDDSGKKLFVHTLDAELYEFKLNGNAEIKQNSKKLIAQNVTKAYAVGDHIGVTSNTTFGIYHNDEYEPVYDDGQPHYPRLLVHDGKAYICDQIGTAPFYICKNGKLKETDTAVVDYALKPGGRIAYLKQTATEPMPSLDLYIIDGSKKPVLIDTQIDMLF